MMINKSYSHYWDLLVDNRNGQPTLIVEVKSKINTSSEWATKLRHNILAYGTLPEVPYFLLVFPDKFYLWVNNSGVHLPKESPDYVIDANPILEPYFQRVGIKADQIGGQSFELMIVSWVEELMLSSQTLEDMDQSQNWLVESGLYLAVAGGKINYEVVA